MTPGERTAELEAENAALWARVSELPVPREQVSSLLAALRDIAIVVGAETPQDEVAAVIRASGVPLLRGLRLFDVYTGPGIPEGKKSLAYTLSFQSPERTLTDAEVEAAQAVIVAALGERLSAELRS